MRTCVLLRIPAAHFNTTVCGRWSNRTSSSCFFRIVLEQSVLCGFSYPGNRWKPTIKGREDNRRLDVQAALPGESQAGCGGPRINTHSPLQPGAPGPHTVRVQSSTSNRHHPEPGHAALWHLARPWFVRGKYRTEVQRPTGGKGATGGWGGLYWPLPVSIGWEWQKKEALSFAS